MGFRRRDEMCQDTVTQSRGDDWKSVTQDEGHREKHTVSDKEGSTVDAKDPRGQVKGRKQSR